MKIAIWLCGLAILAIAGTFLVGVAARERSEAGRAPAVADALFQGLEACDVPGLRERAIGRGNHTTAYVGEFRPVGSVPWVNSASKIFLYVLDGNGTVMIGNTTLPAQRGDFFQLPAGVRHAVRVRNGTLRALYVEDEL
jgi:quercetin dioxygenase-like cupin family protein